MREIVSRKGRRKQCRKFREEREIQIRLAIINNSTSRSLQPFMNFQAVVHLRASTHFSCVRPRASFLTFAARLLKKTGEKGQDGCGTARVRGRKTSTRRASETPHSPRWKTGRNRKKEISRDGGRCWPCAFYGVFNVGGS